MDVDASINIKMYVRQVNEIRWVNAVHEIFYITATWSTKDKFHWPVTGNLKSLLHKYHFKSDSCIWLPKCVLILLWQKSISGVIIAFRLHAVQCMCQFNNITDSIPWASNRYVAKCQPYLLLWPGLQATGKKNNSKWYTKLHKLFCNYCSLVADIEGGKEAEGVWEYGVEENIWT